MKRGNKLAIPQNITKVHLLQAIKLIDKDGVPARRKSTGYDVLYEGKLYPPKYVLAIANTLVNNEELRDFSGGKESNHFLEQRGFKILSKSQGDIEFYINPLISSKRPREYNLYNEGKRDAIIYEYLFNSKSHRSLDESILGIPVNKRTGHESMNILHFIGLKNDHKGIFERIELEKSIEILKAQKSDFLIVIEALMRIHGSVQKGDDLIKVLEEDLDSEKSEEENYYSDGATKYYHGKRYERNILNRKKAIEAHGLTCFGCNFNFEEVYGERGKDFIEIHHIKLLSSLEREMIINPAKDLVPVCSNCHRMIHRKKREFLSIDELKELIKVNKK